MSQNTIYIIKKEFRRFLLENAAFKSTVGQNGGEKINQTGLFLVDYVSVNDNIHPTKFTDKNGNPVKEIDANYLGVSFADNSPADNYLFEELFFDSELEKENIKQYIQGVQVFTKIPKNSLKISVAGGETYSPDFAYIVKCNNGETLNLIVETKNKDKRDLTDNEQQKIAHAKKMFEKLETFVEFREQFAQEDIVQVIQKIAGT